MQVPNSDEMELQEFSYHQAKVEHYLARVEELIEMARYTSAQKLLHTVSTLDPGNPVAGEQLKRIHAYFESLHAAGVSAYRTGNGLIHHTRRKELVLVVDQDERILTALASTLRMYGFGAIGAGTFDEAVEALSDFKPSLIISEVNFENGPVGYDLYLWVRHSEELQSIPFLYLATRVTREMLIAGKRMGVDEFIVKPLDEEVVMASVLNSLSRRKKRVA